MPSVRTSPKRVIPPVPPVRLKAPGSADGAHGKGAGPELHRCPALREVVESSLENVKHQLLSIIDQREVALLDEISSLQERQKELVADNESWRRLFMASSSAHTSISSATRDDYTHEPGSPLPPPGTEGVSMIPFGRRGSPSIRDPDGPEGFADDGSSLLLQSSEVPPELESQDSFCTSPSFFGDFAKRSTWGAPYADSGTSENDEEDDGFRSISKESALQQRSDSIRGADDAQSRPARPNPPRPRLNSFVPDASTGHEQPVVSPEIDRIRRHTSFDTIFV